MHNNDHSSKGRIFILWDSNIWVPSECTHSKHHNTCSAINRGGFQMYFTFVYASNIYADREFLWQHIIKDAENVNKAWMVSGDFSNGLNLKEKKGGLPIPFSHIRDFSNCLLSCGLAEANIQGYKFTWRRKGVATYIDKVLVNDLLLNVFQLFLTIALSSPLSDHNPINIKFSSVTKIDKGRPFRYVKTWFNYEGYSNHVAAGLMTETWG